MEKAIQDALDAVARSCMKLIGSPGLSERTNSRLAKFLYGCMNQRLTIVERVRRRGPGKYAKVLEFASRAAELLAEAEAELQAIEKNAPED